MSCSIRIASVLVAASTLSLSLLACEGDSAGPTTGFDGGAGPFDAPTADANLADTATLPTPTDAAASDASDAALKGTGIGLRVKFLGRPQSFGIDDESSLNDLLQGDTTIVPTREMTITTFDAALLADADVVVLDVLPRAFTLEESQVLRDWVAAGHGLIALSGYGGQVDTNLDSLLQALDVGFTGAADGANAIVVPNPGHAVVEGVSGLRYYGGRSTTTTNATSIEFATLATAPKGIASQHGLGRSVLYGDEWILLDVEVNRVDGAGEKPTHRFWHNALLWSASRID